MFYVKSQIDGETEIKIELNDNNVYCHCPGCGREIEADIVPIRIHGDYGMYGMYGISEWCDACRLGIFLKEELEKQ